MYSYQEINIEMDDVMSKNSQISDRIDALIEKIDDREKANAIAMMLIIPLLFLGLGWIGNSIFAFSIGIGISILYAFIGLHKLRLYRNDRNRVHG